MAAKYIGYMVTYIYDYYINTYEAYKPSNCCHVYDAVVDFL